MARSRYVTQCQLTADVWFTSINSTLSSRAGARPLAQPLMHTQQIKSQPQAVHGTSYDRYDRPNSTFVLTPRRNNNNNNDNDDDDTIAIVMLTIHDSY